MHNNADSMSLKGSLATELAGCTGSRLPLCPKSGPEARSEKQQSQMPIVPWMTSSTRRVWLGTLVWPLIFTCRYLGEKARR